MSCSVSSSVRFFFSNVEVRAGVAPPRSFRHAPHPELCSRRSFSVLLPARPDPLVPLFRIPRTAGPLRLALFVLLAISGRLVSFGSLLSPFPVFPLLSVSPLFSVCLLFPLIPFVSYRAVVALDGLPGLLVLLRRNASRRRHVSEALRHTFRADCSSVQEEEAGL